MNDLKYKSSLFIIRTVPSYFSAKKKQLSFYEDLQPIAASIKESLLLLRSTIVLNML